MALKTKLYNNCKVEKSLTAATYTSDQNGATVDMQGYQDLMFVANVGVSGDTLSGTVYHLLEVEHSDDNSAWTDCTDDEIVNAVTGTNTGTFAVIDDPAEDDVVAITAYKGDKRYVRCVLNVVGTHTNGTPVSITSIKGQAAALPVNS